MHTTIYNLLTGLVENDSIKVNHTLRSEAYLQIRASNRMQIYWTRPKVRHALLAEFSKWSNPCLNIIDISVNGTTVAAAFEIKVTSGRHPRTFERYALIKLKEHQIQTIILYCHDKVPTQALQPSIGSLTFPTEALISPQLAYTF